MRHRNFIEAKIRTPLSVRIFASYGGRVRLRLRYDGAACFAIRFLFSCFTKAAQHFFCAALLWWTSKASPSVRRGGLLCNPLPLFLLYQSSAALFLCRAALVDESGFAPESYVFSLSFLHTYYAFYLNLRSPNVRAYASAYR